jgi:hypothetical protein
MATPKGPKFGEMYSYVMADPDIKFEPNRSRQKFQSEKCHRPKKKNK